VRYERDAENFLGMLHLACSLILLRGLMASRLCAGPNHRDSPQLPP
jgi:hypothetical protein